MEEKHKIKQTNLFWTKIDEKWIKQTEELGFLELNHLDRRQILCPEPLASSVLGTKGSTKDRIQERWNLVQKLEKKKHVVDWFRLIYHEKNPTVDWFKLFTMKKKGVFLGYCWYHHFDSHLLPLFGEMCGDGFVGKKEYSLSLFWEKMNIVFSHQKEPAQRCICAVWNQS